MLIELCYPQSSHPSNKGYGEIYPSFKSLSPYKTPLDTRSVMMGHLRSSFGD